MYLYTYTINMHLYICVCVCHNYMFLVITFMLMKYVKTSITSARNRAHHQQCNEQDARLFRRRSLWKKHGHGHAIPMVSIYGYGSIPINTIFRGMNIHKSQLF